MAIEDNHNAQIFHILFIARKLHKHTHTSRYTQKIRNIIIKKGK